MRRILVVFSYIHLYVIFINTAQVTLHFKLCYNFIEEFAFLWYLRNTKGVFNIAVITPRLYSLYGINSLQCALQKDSEGLC